MERIQPDTTLPKETKIMQLVAILTQDGTNAPEITIIKNTTSSNVTTSRILTGQYKLTFTDWELPKDLQVTGWVIAPSYDYNIGYSARPNNYNEVLIVTTDGGIPADDCLFNARIIVNLQN